MKRNKKRKILNWVMMISLIVVMTTGMLLRVMPGMRLGITHGGSGIILTVGIVIHCFWNIRKGQVAEQVS